MGRADKMARMRSALELSDASSVRRTMDGEISVLHSVTHDTAGKQRLGHHQDHSEFATAFPALSCASDLYEANCPFVSTLIESGWLSSTPDIGGEREGERGLDREVASESSNKLI